MPRLSAEKLMESDRVLKDLLLMWYLNYLSLQKGRNYVSLCHFRRDNHPSICEVSPERTDIYVFGAHMLMEEMFLRFKNYLKDSLY